MERTRNLKSGLKASTVAVFFAAALLSTGCSNNALMNPQIPSSTQSATTAHSTGHDVQPGGHDVQP
jgi:hypothetical protein